MPLVKIQTSLSKVNDEENFLKEISTELSTLTGKPEAYVMTLLQTNTPMTFAGSNDPCCFVEIKSIGSLNPSLMTKCFCNLISSHTNIPPNRIYIAFQDVNASQWGFNGNTFG